MGQISVKIYAPPGSLLSGNLHPWLIAGLTLFAAAVNLAQRQQRATVR
jgi:hypothetical protein